MNKLVKSKKGKKGVKVIRYFFGTDNISFEKTYSYVWRCDGAERVWGWNYIGNITHILPPYIPKFFLLYSNNATNYRDAMKLGRQKMMTHKMYLRVDRQSCAISQKWHAYIHTHTHIHTHITHIPGLLKWRGSGNRNSVLGHFATSTYFILVAYAIIFAKTNVFSRICECFIGCDHCLVAYFGYAWPFIFLP